MYMKLVIAILTFLNSAQASVFDEMVRYESKKTMIVDVYPDGESIRIKTLGEDALGNIVSNDHRLCPPKTNSAISEEFRAINFKIQMEQAQESMRKERPVALSTSGLWDSCVSILKGS